MDQYSIFHQSKIKQLWSTREGRFRQTYQLTDGTYSYGMLSHSGFFDPIVQIDTSESTWIVRKTGMSTMEVVDSEGLLTAIIERKWFTSKIIFTAINGFTATYYQPSFWGRAQVWISKDQQVLITQETRGFSQKDTFTYADLTYQQPYLLLLSFLAMEFKLGRRRGAAV